MRDSTSNLLILATLAVAAGMVGYVLWHETEEAPREKIGFQDADAPLAMPGNGAPDHRFHMLTAWQAARVPVALRFDPPLGSEHGALTYNAQKFREMNEKRGGRHTGDDLNGIGGMDSDLGDTVFSVADGLVIYSGEPSSGWGDTIIIAHRAADGRMLHSMYSHLDRIDVARDQLVSRGARIGTVGTGNGNYPAHLHFEMRESDGADIGAGYTMYPLNSLDPTATIGALRGAPGDDLSHSPLVVALASARPWTALEIRGAEKFTGLPAGSEGSE
ncbi:MAG TPA: M23 family metallopeptidase [Luteolibacter sp.]|nr:M23 family metallopeptidase [Luteolibacter sp.]